MGKGSRRRPQQVSDEEFEDNWNAVFKRDKKNVEKNRYKRGQRGDKKTA